MRAVYEVHIVIPSAGLTMRIASMHNQLDAVCEARRLHSTDQQPYKVIKVDKQCVYKINSD